MSNITGNKALHEIVVESSKQLGATTILCLLVLFPTAGWISYTSLLDPLKQYPGPFLARFTSLIYWRHLLRGDGIPYMISLHHKYGPIVRYSPNELSYATGQAWKEIYGIGKSRAENPKDPRLYIRPREHLPPAITQAGPTEHARIRHIFSPAFSERGLRQQEHLFQKYADLMVTKLAELPNGKPIDMVKMLNYTTFDVMAELTFGNPLGLLEGSDYSSWVATIFSALRVLPFSYFLNSFPFFKFLHNLFAAKGQPAGITNHTKTSSTRVDERIENGSTQPDIWNLIVNDDGESKLTRQEMYSNARVFMTAGTETTATLLSGLLFYLCKNPQIMRQLQTEVQGSFAHQGDITFEKLAAMPYLNACIHEALRMYPPVPSALPRLAQSPGIMVCDQFVPPGTVISVHPVATYRNPNNFKNPNTFAPERWLAAKEYAGDHLEAAQPFQVGPRNCIGQSMAWHEMRLLLAKLMYNFNVKLYDESSNWTDQRSFLLWEKPPLMCTLARASAVA